MDTERVAEVLEAAADSILVHGWGQFIEWRYDEATDTEVPRCVLGHITNAVDQRHDQSTWESRYSAPVCAFQSYIFLENGWSLIGWNDAPCRTEGDVRDALLLCAKDLRNSL